MATTSDAAEAAPVRLLGTGRRRRRWLAAGVGLIVAGALGAVLAWEQADQRQGVVVAAADLPAGHVLEAGDVRVVDLAGAQQLAAVPSEQLDQALGQRLAVPVHAGTLVSETALTEPHAYPQPGQAVVGAALEPGRFPASLEPGAQVSIVLTGGPQEEAPPGASAVPAQVRDLAAAPDGTGSARVELVVEGSEAQAVAQAAATGGLSLVQVPNEGES